MVLGWRWSFGKREGWFFGGGGARRGLEQRVDFRLGDCRDRLFVSDQPAVIVDAANWWDLGGVGGFDVFEVFG